MNVLLMGATGAIGRQMMPRLLQQGHTVFAGTRQNRDRAALSSAGASPVVFDALDHNATVEALCRLRPDAIVHQMTALGHEETRNARTKNRYFIAMLERRETFHG